MSKDTLYKLTGVQKAALVLLSISEDSASKVFSMMAEDEIKELSASMSTLGSIKQETVEKVLLEFASEMSSAVSFVGNIETTEKLLSRFMDKEKVNTLIDEIRGPAGKSTWDKLANISEELLASYLRNEYPQTAALVLSKISPMHASKVLSVLPDDLSYEIIVRMLNLTSVRKEVIENVEKVLRTEFISTLTKSQTQDTNQMLAEIFNNFDRVNESKFMGYLERDMPDSANVIKNLMFTFDDMVKVEKVDLQVVLRNVDKNKLAMALKGANEKIRAMFIESMSQRAAKIMQEDMESMGPVRLRDVDEAQGEVVRVTKELISRGEVRISDPGSSDEYVY